MKVAVAGLGLIGGSFYKASLAASYDTVGLHHGDRTGFEDADLILVCLPPEAIVPWVVDRAALFKPGALVVDICGTKRTIVSQMANVPKQGWKFVGGHPMAGREVSGWENSLATLFVGASMIITPGEDITESEINTLRQYFASVGFERTVVTDAAHHDEMIAFTSQLCHVIATAYTRDPLVNGVVGFSAGSYANMTRIATQDPAVWSSLFLDDREPLLAVVDRFIARLQEFRSSLAAQDKSAIEAMILAGAQAKREELLKRKRGDECV